jgi:DNA helicase-2/ATP-dependent DNA helicase PcrA
MSEKMLLNKKQLEAIYHIDGPLVVIAGAGSGKTAVVVQRIAHLLENGVFPHEILALTFTNKAASELRERLEKRALTPPLTVTFHALGVRILRESIHHFGYTNNFSIFDQSDSESLIGAVMVELTGKKEKKDVKEMKSNISSAKSKLISPQSHFSKELFFASEGERAFFFQVYALYQERLKGANAVDFDDLISLTVQILQDKELHRIYADRWKYLLVDEYQDTNHAQYLICKALCSKHKNIFVVGDPDQSIYSWRGAKISNILHFEKDFPGAHVIALEQNYRSTSHILSAANYVIQKNDRLYEKNLYSEKGDGEKVYVHPFSNGYEESRFVVQEIKKALKEGVEPQEIVIFYRTNSQSRMFEDSLIEQKIPYHIIGGLSFYQRKEIKDILAFLRMIVAPFDTVSFSRIIHLPKRGLGPKSIEKIISASRESQKSIIDILREALAGKALFKLTTTALEGLKDFLNVMDRIQTIAMESKSIAHLIREVYALSRYSVVLSEEKDSMGDRLENIDELISKADGYDKEHQGSLQSFLEDVCLDGQKTNSEGDQHRISLMTIHNAKGLEFRLCFIVGLEEDVFPHIRAKNRYEEIEEERRLFYVGMTRAKERLYMTFAKRRFLWGTEKILTPSRFLKELPKEHIAGNEISIKNEVSIEAQDGSRVSHRTFGKGFIVKVYETSYGVTYDVVFDSDLQTRTLVAKYAKLTVL